MVKEDGIPSRANRKKKVPNKRRNIRLFIFTILLITIVFSFFGCSKVLGVDQWKDFDPEKLTNIKQTSFLYDQNNQIITGLYGEENRIKISIDKVPQHVRNAFIATEDVRFYQHKGIDFRRIVSALWEDIKSGGYKQGASTISQQLIKNSHLTQQKTISRKLQEMYLSYQLEKKYTKDQILEMYLNFIYFGKGAYGIEAASKTYFGKSVSELSIAEGAMLAGIPKSPSKYSPFLNLNESLTRRNLIIDLMKKYNFITETEATQAKAEKPLLAEEKKSTYSYGYFVDQVIRDASKQLNIKEDEIYTGGYKIYTTLDRNLQKYCESIFSDPKYFPKSINGKQVESALVIIQPQTGDIKTLIGGREHKAKLSFSRATQMTTRQPGSTIKPVIDYAPAIEKYSYSPATLILDEPTSFGNYKPSNYGGKSYGWVTVRSALANSINIPAVKVLNDIGINSGKTYAESVGIPFQSEDRDLAIALGGFHTGVSPLQLCNAYMPFANNGNYAPSSTIRYIESPDGTVIYRYAPKWKRVLSQESAFLITNMLESVIQWGTGKRLNKLGLPLAGKTGTVQLPDEGKFRSIRGNKDAWMVVYNPEYITTIWMGYDETDEKHYLPYSITGGTYPADILSRVFSFIYKDKKAPDFNKPSGIIEAKIDTKTLEDKHEVVLANALTPDKYASTEYFTQSTLPTKETDYWIIPQPPEDLAVETSPDKLPLISFTPRNSFIIYQIYRQKELSPPVLIGERSDKNLRKIFLKDNLAIPGETYKYYIIPIHPEIQIDKKALEGPVSTSVTYTVPLAIYPPESPLIPPENTNDSNLLLQP